MKVAVIGAGIGGLTFAAAMRRFCPDADVDVYERDQGPESRSQGYSLGLNGDKALAVLKSLDLYERLAGNLVTVTRFVFCDQRGHPLLELPATGDEKRLTQRVPRHVLKDALLQGAFTTPIHYAHHCTGYQQQDNGIEALFEGGERVGADYLIAGDGISSALRQQLIGDEKRYLGLTALWGEALLAIEHPFLRGGYFMTLGDEGTSIFCYRQPEGIHLSYVVHAASADELKAQSPAELLRRIQRATSAWHPPIPEIAAAIDPATIVVNGYYDKEPAKHVRDGRLWLIGDAAHPMCPFQGEGANTAMVDALKLAKYFGDSQTAPDRAETNAGALEADIIARGSKAVLASRTAARRFHETNPMRQRLRNASFQIGNIFIQMGSRGGAAS